MKKATKPITVNELAKLIDDELERDEWGDIDEVWFKFYEFKNDSELDDDEKALREVLQRVVAKLNKRFGVS